MKIKNILKLKDSLESKTSEIRLNAEGDPRTTLRFDVYEEQFFLSFDDKEIPLNINEARKLKSVLNSML